MTAIGIRSAQIPHPVTFCCAKARNAGTPRHISVDHLEPGIRAGVPNEGVRGPLDPVVKQGGKGMAILEFAGPKEAEYEPSGGGGVGIDEEFDVRTEGLRLGRRGGRGETVLAG